MSDKTKVLIAIVATALVVGGASALAGGGGGAPDRHAFGMGGGRLLLGHHRGPGPFAAAAPYLGLTVEQLFQQLREGKSLADIAKAQGKSVDGLKAAMLAQLKTNLDGLVANGRITAAQEQRMLDEAKAHIDAVVNGKLPAPRGSELAQAAAKYLGLTEAQLREQLRGGKSLADVAKAQGKSVDGLKDALVAAFRSHVDQVVNEKHADRPLGPLFGLRRR